MSQVILSKLEIVSPFKLWAKAISSDAEGQIRTSKSWFSRAAEQFFAFGSGQCQHVGRAYFEYSTLMEAFARIQEGRVQKRDSKYEDSLTEFTKASEILRSTVHFGFLSSYETGCATLETALEMSDSNEAFQAFKNAIALFEQSKFALGLRDEKHPVINVIDSLIKRSVANALLTESRILSDLGKSGEARSKAQQSKEVDKDHRSFARRARIRPNTILYFPIGDWKRADTTGFVVSYPEQSSIWLGNVGSNPITVETLGSDVIGAEIGPAQSISCPISISSRGRIRITYHDCKENKKYDEGCLLMI